MGSTIIKIIKSEPSWNDDIDDWNVEKSDILDSTVGGFQEEEGVNFNQFDFNSSHFENMSECAYPSAVFMNSAVTNESSLAKDLNAQTEEPDSSHQNIKIISVVDRKQNENSPSDEESNENNETPDYVLNASSVGDNVLQINIYKVQTPTDQSDNKWSIKKEDNKFVKKDVSERMFECRECSEKFFEANELLTHFKLHEGGKVNDALKWNYPYICKKCDKGFTSTKGLLMHYQTHQRLTTCAEGDTGDKKWTVFWQCPYCSSEKFSSFLLLCQHMTCHKFNYCQFCKISFINNNDLQTHFGLKHNKKMGAMPSPEKPQTKSNYSRKDVHSINAYKCRHCQCLFINANALLKHEKKHLKQPQTTQHQCSICEKIFTNKCNLTAHINDDHKIKSSKIANSLQTSAASIMNSDSGESSNGVGVSGEACREELMTLDIKTEPLETDEYYGDNSSLDQHPSAENDNFSVNSSQNSVEYDSSCGKSNAAPQTVMFITTKNTVNARSNTISTVNETMSVNTRLRPSITDIVNNSITTVESESRGRGRRERKIYTCPICQKVFHLKALFTSHLERHKDLSLDS